MGSLFGQSRALDSLLRANEHILDAMRGMNLV